MKYLILLLMCAGIAQAQPKPEIFTLSGPATFLMWNTQSAQTKNAKWTLDEKTSTLRWMGKPIVGSGHEGTIQFLSGAVTISSVGLPVQGEVVMNMNTIKATDLKEESSAQDLENHLKDDDFFSVTKYPHASLSILKVTPEALGGTEKKARITAQLTIKGISNRVVFLATLSNDKDGIRIRADLTIDRTKWGINYQSKSIFLNMKDNIISDDVQISVDLNFVGC
ncbi:MAG TPA: YceI family protein [Cyclobacteriaceae bacterium]|jgi:polyisoprenoid-binding protein YceI|nr:YceI family protein [Cytophagales bacterium]HRE65481.1 YceI family protein [Cyclobacteriaceae bacterium]HRF32601.1 YceI family protein [Cyclobacteriaceae bacterium]